ncbi:MAG: hypothetical protein RIE52_12075 [Balneola sp.]
MSKTINISKLNKAEVLAELYNNSKPMGLGWLQADDTPMSTEEAQSLLDDGYTYFDYLKGRVMKIDLSTNELKPFLYDRDNGQGSVQRIVNHLLKKGVSDE